ncbi:MAG: hypothetical protein JW703_00705 [Candidatus Diapherotrites archaeon]|nr:hypothetical protein [Candidatus Diapherotrites archaeon]
MKKLLILLILSVFLFGCGEELIKCGDGKCHSLNETAQSCPQDCDPNYDPTAVQLCGNGTIDAGENCSNCLADVSCAQGTECKSGVCVEIENSTGNEIENEEQPECLTNADCFTGFECSNNNCIAVQQENETLNYNFINKKVSSIRCNDPVITEALQVIFDEKIVIGKSSMYGRPASESKCNVKTEDGVLLYDIIMIPSDLEELALTAVEDEKEQILSQWFDSIQHPSNIGTVSYLFEQQQPTGSFFRIVLVDDDQSVFMNIRAVKETTLNEVKGVATALVKAV